MRETVPPRLFATHTAPPAAAMPVGPAPTAIVWVTAAERGSMRETVSSWVFATQTAPSPTAIADGPCPTRIGVATALAPAGSIRVTVLSIESVTQTLPAPVAIAVGLLPMGILSAIRWLRGIDACDLAIGGQQPDRALPDGDRVDVHKVTAGSAQLDRDAPSDGKSGSSRTSLSPGLSPIQTPSAPAAIPPTLPCPECVPTTAFVSRSTWVTVSSP